MYNLVLDLKLTGFVNFTLFHTRHLMSAKRLYNFHLHDLDWSTETTQISVGKGRFSLARVRNGISGISRTMIGQTRIDSGAAAAK